MRIFIPSLGTKLLDYTHSVFLAPHGDDTNSGLNINEPVKTLSKAYTVAATLSPAANNFIEIVAARGTYTEDAFVQFEAYVDINGPEADFVFTGGIVGWYMQDGNFWNIRSVDFSAVTTGGAIWFRQTGDAVLKLGSGNFTGVNTIIQTSGVNSPNLFVIADQITANNKAIQSLGANSKIHLDVGHIYLDDSANDATALRGETGGKFNGTIGCIIDLNGTGGANSTFALDMTNGAVAQVYIGCIETDEIRADGAGTRALIITPENFPGTITETTGGDVRITTAEHTHDATEITYTPTTSGDWDVVPDDSAEAMDELASRIESAEAVLAGGVSYQGGYNATTNTPNLTTPTAGDVLKGYMYTVTVAGTFFGETLEVGDVLIAEVDDPSAGADWTIVNKNIELVADAVSYTPSTPGDWNVTPTLVDGALDELASRVEATENAGYLIAADIDTLAELNAIVTDATLIDTNDTRLNSDIESYTNFASFPGTGESGTLYIAEDTGFLYYWDGAAYQQTGADTKEVKVSSDDTTPGFLLDKVVGETGFIEIVEVNGGADEDLQIKLNADFNNLLTNVLGTVWASGLLLTENSRLALGGTTNDQTVDIDSGTYYINGVLYEIATNQNFDLTTQFTSLANGERAIATIYVDTDEVIKVSLGTPVSGNNKAEPPAAIVDTVCLAFVEISKTGGGANNPIIDDDIIDWRIPDTGVMLSATDEFVKVSPDDTTTGYLEDKAIGTTNKITTTVLNDGANEQLQFSIGSDVFDKTVDDIFDVNYTPTTGGDWPDPDPTDAGTALDSLAAVAFSALQSGDIDTLAELNAIITDATLIDTNDSRLHTQNTDTGTTSTTFDVNSGGNSAQLQTDLLTGNETYDFPPLSGTLAVVNNFTAEYFLSSDVGDDSYSGLNEHEPMATLDAVLDAITTGGVNAAIHFLDTNIYTVTETTGTPNVRTTAVTLHMNLHGATLVGQAGGVTWRINHSSIVDGNVNGSLLTFAPGNVVNTQHNHQWVKIDAPTALYKTIPSDFRSFFNVTAQNAVGLGPMYDIDSPTNACNMQLESEQIAIVYNSAVNEGGFIANGAKAICWYYGKNIESINSGAGICYVGIATNNAECYVVGNCTQVDSGVNADSGAKVWADLSEGFTVQMDPVIHEDNGGAGEVLDYSIRDGKNMSKLTAGTALDGADLINIRDMSEAAISKQRKYTLSQLTTFLNGQLSFLASTDIDTLAELNAIITDATLIDTNDSRLTSEVDHYANFAAFPGTGAANTLYVDEATGTLYYWDGAAYQTVGDGTGAAESLAATLLVGNTTGGTDIAFGTDKATFSTAEIYYSGGLNIVGDAGFPNVGSIFLDTSLAIMAYDETSVLLSATEIQFKKDTIESAFPEVIARFDSSQNFVLNDLVTQAIIWDPKNNAFTATLDITAPTQNNTFTFQNGSGTIAFLTDIPSLAGYVQTTDIDTLSELNAIITDATLGNVVDQDAIYVGAYGNDANDGRRADDAVATLDEAIDKANAASIKQIIHVGAGTLQVNEKSYDGLIYAPEATIETFATTAATAGLTLTGYGKLVAAEVYHKTGDIGVEIESGSVDHYVYAAYSDLLDKPIFKIDNNAIAGKLNIGTLFPVRDSHTIAYDMGLLGTFSVGYEINITRLALGVTGAALKYVVLSTGEELILNIGGIQKNAGDVNNNLGIVEMTTSGVSLNVERYLNIPFAKFNDSASSLNIYSNAHVPDSAIDNAAGGLLRRRSGAEGIHVPDLTNITSVETTDSVKTYDVSGVEHKEITWGDIITSLNLTTNGLVAADIDTLSELNAIITDATLIDTNDSRLDSQVEEHVNFAAFPGTGVDGVIYVDEATGLLYRWDGAAYQAIGGGTSKKTFSIMGSRDTNVNLDTDMRVDSLFTNTTPVVITPNQAGTYTLGIAGASSAADTWEAHVYKNGVTVANVALAAQTKNQNTTASIVVAAGDEIRLRAVNVVGSVSRPRISTFWTEE